MKIILMCYITQNWKVDIYSNSGTMQFVLFFSFKNYLPRVFLTKEQKHSLFFVFPIFSSSLRHTSTRLLINLSSIYYMQFILLHDNQISIRYLIYHFIIRQMQIFHERCNLSQQTGVAYYFCFAVSIFTFFAKTDSL